jgi:hypothetical protein
MVTINRFSWLLRDQLRQKNGIQFWDYFESPIGPDDLLTRREDDIEHTVTGFDRIDNLAQQFYGDPHLWWVIALVNDLRLLPIQLQCGRVIRIPSPSFVKKRLLIPRED